LKGVISHRINKTEKFSKAFEAKPFGKLEVIKRVN